MPYLKIRNGEAKSKWSEVEAKLVRNGYRRGMWEGPLWAKTKYEGEYKNDLKHGQGRMTYKNSGIIYDGSWIKGKREGKGSLYKIQPDGERVLIYSGLYKNGKPHGFGKKVSKSGNVYEGQLEEGEFNGVGSMQYSNGSIYMGQWKDGLYHGSGRLFDFEAGTLFDGEFVEGAKSGLGRTYVLKKAVIQEGVWKSDSPVVSFVQDDYRRRAVAPEKTPVILPNLRLKDHKDVYERFVGDALYE